MREIPLTQGRVALVDDEDYKRLAQRHWHYDRGYACRSVSTTPRRRQMANEILHLPPTVMVDHKNGNKLDNQKANLRVATAVQNSTNRSIRKGRTGYRGVQQRAKGWFACIASEGRRYYLGVFDTPEEAARAYDAKAKELHGEFARTNF